MALAHPSDERRSAPPSLARRHALRAPQTASGGPRRRTPPHARRTVPQTLTTSGKTRLRYDRARRRAQKPQSTTVATVTVTGKRPCGFFCSVGRFFFGPHGVALGIMAIGGGPEDPVTDALAGVEEAEAAAAEYSTTATVAKNAATRPFVNSPLTAQEIQATGTGVPDPGGIPGALRYDVPGTFNGSQGTYELVIDPQTNTVYHFNFVTH